MNKKSMSLERKLNCWEYHKCGRQPGGEKAGSLGVCVAAIAKEANGIHNGLNAGRCCWAVSGTLCKGEIQGTFVTKFKHCIECEFFKYVSEQENFKLVSPSSIHKLLSR